MLLSLTLKNFKQHDSIHLDFTRGVNTITGENFAGKSSLLHGLLYAFFGSLAVPGGQKIIQKRGTQGHSAEASWAEGDKVYHIKRTSSLCNLWLNGKEDEHLIATSASAVAVKLTELFGMDRAEFCDIKYSEQKKAEQMLTLGAQRVHALIEKIVDADRVNDVVDRTKKEVQRIEIQLESMPLHNLKELLETKEGFESFLATSRVKLSETEAKLPPLEVIRTTATNDLQELKTKSALQVQAISRYFELMRELDDVERSFQSAMGKLSARPQFSPLEDIQRARVAVEGRIEAAELSLNKWNVYDSAFSRASTTYKHYQSKFEDCQQYLNSLPVLEFNSTLDELQNHKSALEGERQQKREQLAILNNELTHLRHGKDNAACHTCKRPFEGKNIDQIEDSIEQKQGEVTQLNESLAVCASSISAVEDRITRLKTSESAIAEMEAAEKARDEAKVAMEAISKPHGEKPSPTLLAQLKEQLSTLSQQERDVQIEEVTLRNLREQVSDLTQKKTQLSVRITEVVDQHKLTAEQVTPGAVETPFKAEITALQNKLIELDGQHRELSNAIIREKESIASTAEKIAAVSDKILLAQKCDEERTALHKRFDLCKRLNKFLRDNKDSFLAEVWQRVMGYASAVAQTCTGGKISEVVRTSDGKFEYWEDGEVFPVEAASGAQRSIMGLGVQLALSEMLPSPFDSLLLDEPTADMSETVSMSLATLLSKSGSQVLMVSHRELDGTVSDNSIHL